MTRLVVLTAACALMTAACGDPVVDRPDTLGIIDLDGGIAPPPPRPQVEAVPRVQPYPLASIRGRARARRIYVEGTGNRRSYAVQTDGSFCLDVPLAAEGSYELYLTAQADDGQLSEPSEAINLTFDPGAPAVPGAVTCRGADPAGCSSAFEICGNGKDDDCNNLIDEDDPRCRPCQDDLLEPNDEIGSPRLSSNAIYENLEICPADPDWYAVYLDGGQTVDAVIRFSHPEGDLNLSLIAPNRRDLLAESRTLTNVEMLSHTSSTAGTFHLQVSASDVTRNRYTLELSVRDP